MSRVLVSASRRNNLSFVFRPKLTEQSRKKFAIAKTRSPVTRDVCAPQTRSFDGYAFGEVAWFIDVASQFDG
jgi:hypothetical protein